MLTKYWWSDPAWPGVYVNLAGACSARRADALEHHLLGVASTASSTNLSEPENIRTDVSAPNQAEARPVDAP